MQKKKITELTEPRWRTAHSFDAYGNRVRERVEYIGKRPVKSVKPGPRFGHFIVDFIIFRIIMLIVQFIFVALNLATQNNRILNLSTELFYSILFLVMYPMLYALCEYFFDATPGKLLTKTVVIDEYGNKPDFGTILLRSFIRIVPFEPFSCFENYSHGWHDEWSNTWVVPKTELAELKRLQEEQSTENED